MEFSLVSDLNGAITEFLASRQARGVKPNTIRSEQGVLRAFMAANGNILIRNINGTHIDRYLTKNSHLSAGTINRNRGYLSGFFAWCRARKYMSQTHNPLEGTRKIPVPPRDFIFVPVERFGELLDSAKNQRDRTVLALGLYTLQRISTVGWFKWGDVFDSSPNPREWHIQSYSPKIETKDQLPLALELKHELDRWRLEYGRLAGQVPDPNWYIVPPFKKGRYTNDAATGKLVRVGDPQLNPLRPLRKAEDIVQYALSKMGYEDVKHEGGHTLRRSGGKALYDELAWERGHDGAIRIVQSMMGHKSLATTEHYLRLTLERKRRNDLLAGGLMFPKRDAAVIEMERAAE